MPDQPALGGGPTESIIHPAVAVGMLVAIALIFVVPRKYAVVPVLFSIFLIPEGQQVVIGGVHWLAGRIIFLCALLSVRVTRKAPLAGGFDSIDQAFLSCVLIQAVAVVLQFNLQSQAWINQFGFLIDFLAGYFVLRALIQDEDDIYRALKCMAALTVILGICMYREQLTVQNIFGVLGGTRLIPEIREGKIRSQGVFQHSLTAGTFAAVLLPLFVLLWRNGKAKAWAALGFLGSTLMTICSNGSTPLLGYAGGLLGIALWPVRRKMRTVRWGLVFSLVALHLVMKAPVWFLIARVDLTGSSSGYHRAMLVDQFIRHFWDWWLMGSQNKGSWGWDLWDTQNQYVTVGETGGLGAFVFFIAMISRCCARIGNARKLVEGEPREWFFWLLGAAMFANLVAFFGVNYFDQSKVGWFMLLAMISAATAPIVRKASEPVEAKVVHSPADDQDGGQTSSWEFTRRGGWRGRRHAPPVPVEALVGPEDRLVWC